MNKLILYIHGKGGNAEEAEHYKPLFADCDVIGFDYSAQSPWEAKEEFPKYFDSVSKNYDFTEIIANSIGAFFAMHSLADKKNRQGISDFALCRYGKFNFKYDDMGERYRKRTP